MYIVPANNSVLYDMGYLTRVMYAGRASLTTLRSLWPFLCSAAATAWHQNIWREIWQLTMTRASAYDLRGVTNRLFVAPD